MILTRHANMFNNGPEKKKKKKRPARQRGGEISRSPRKPLFDDRPVRRDSPEKEENKSEGSHKIRRGQKNLNQDERANTIREL